MLRVLNLPLIFAALLGGPLAAQDAGEEFIFPVLPGYPTAGTQTKQDNVVTTTWLPNGETADNWTDMMMSVVFPGSKEQPQDYEATQEKAWMPNCALLSVKQLSTGVEQGYPTALWQVGCANNPATGKPEYAWFKAILGNDSLYVMSRTFRFDLSSDQQKAAVLSVNSAIVCGTKPGDPKCPVTVSLTPPKPQ
jgi:hypothetical protein